MIPISLFAQTDRAILYPGQGITLNGNSLQTSSAVMSGDTIQTSSAPAQLTGHDLIAQVEPNTTVQYGDVLLLSCGAVIVSSPGHGVQASDTRVTPVGGTTKFEMINRDGKLKINVQSGTVRVSNDQVTTLSAGQSIERDSEGCPLPPGFLKTDPTASGVKHKWVLVGAGGGAVAAGIFMAERKPASPSHP